MPRRLAVTPSQAPSTSRCFIFNCAVIFPICLLTSPISSSVAVSAHLPDSKHTRVVGLAGGSLWWIGDVDAQVALYAQGNPCRS
jgi:hypothetical protein